MSLRQLKELIEGLTNRDVCVDDTGILVVDSSTDLEVEVEDNLG